MSVQAMSWVIEKSRHKGSSFVVLLMIANYAHKDGSGAFPSFETLAIDSRITVRQVTRLIPVLERSGELIVEHGKGPHGTNRYTINMRQFRLPMDKMSNGQTRSSNVQRSVRNQSLDPSPLPPTNVGDEETLLDYRGKTIAVKMGNRRRLPQHKGGVMFVNYYVEFLNEHGFPARIVEAA